jgi:hypothetical protein
MAKNPNQAKIVILIVAVAAMAVAVGILLRNSRSSSRPPSGPSPLIATDKNGDKWVLEMASVPFLPASGDSIAKIGAPLLLKTDVQIVGRDVSIGLILAGQAGETYIPGAQKNGQRLPAPGLKILDEAGKTLAADTFQYG